MQPPRLFPLALLSALGCNPPVPCINGRPQAEGSSLSVRADRCGEVSLEGTVQGEGDLSVHFTYEGAQKGFVPTVVAGEGGGVLTAVVAQGPYSLAGDAPIRLWRQGYQSWSFSGVVATEAITTDPLTGLPEVAGDGDAFSVAWETPFTSWWGGLVGRSGGSTLHIGATQAAITKVWTAWDDQRAMVIWGGRGESISLDSYEEITLDPVGITFGADAHDQWSTWADVVARRLETEPPSAPPPVGWATWYQFYEDVDEQDVRDNLTVATDLEWGTESPVFQLDDGWQIAWGEWTAGADFPSGMAQLAADIRAAGFVPGLWMAPFYVDHQASAYQLHRDWWVRHADGSEIVFNNLGSGPYAIIDVTHPDAVAWLEDQIRARVDEGWVYLKLDFLYAGAQEGLRSQDVTGTEAYLQGMTALRAAAGEDTWILACGAPLLPSVGFADSYRSGADIAFTIARDPRPEFLRWQGRQTAARGWANGRWWYNDPDQILVREPFTTAEARGSVVANVVSGGTWLLGDDLGALAPELLLLALHPDLLATRGATVRPIDPLGYVSGIDNGPLGEAANPDDEVPVAWTLSSGEVVLLNLGDGEVSAIAPAGTELLTGRTTALPTTVTVAPGDGQVWVPTRP